MFYSQLLTAFYLCLLIGKSQDFPPVSTTTTADPRIGERNENAFCGRRPSQTSCEAPYPKSSIFVCRWDPVHGTCSQVNEPISHICFAIEHTNATSPTKYKHLLTAIKNVINTFKHDSWVGIVTYGEGAPKIDRFVKPISYNPTPGTVLDGITAASTSQNNAREGITECLTQLQLAAEIEAVKPGHEVLVTVAMSDPDLVTNPTDLCERGAVGIDDTVWKFDISTINIYGDYADANNKYECVVDINSPFFVKISLSDADLTTDPVPANLIDADVFDEFFTTLLPTSHPTTLQPTKAPNTVRRLLKK